MSDRRPVTLVATSSDGEMIIEAVLDDGYADDDGIALDPDWLARAVREWMEQGGTLRDQKLNVQARATETWQSGSERMIRARVVDETIKGALKGRLPLHVSLGIYRPTLKRSDSAPMGAITDGRLNVWLEGTPDGQG